MNTEIWRSIGKELQPSYLFQKVHLMPALVSGILIGLMTSILSISFGVLVFGKAIPEAIPIGIGMALFSNVILHIGSALGSSREGIVAHVQSLLPPIQAAMLSTLVGQLPSFMPIEHKIVVAVFSIFLSAILTGAILYLFGRLKFGKLVRLLPFPVIGGFLASVGFALVKGGSAIMLGSLTFSSFFELLDVAQLAKWLPGVLLATVLGVMTSRWKNVLSFPVILGVAIVLFYIFCYIIGLNLADMKANNLLLGPFPPGQLWHPPHVYFKHLSDIDFTVITSQIGIMATIPLVSFIGGLLMLSAVELFTGKEMDPSFELKTTGISNFISGIAGGGFIGYTSTTFTVMQRTLGSSTRLAGLLSAIVSIVVLIAGASFLGFIPKFVVSGILIFFGYQFIDHWVIKQWKHSSVSDIGVVIVIVIVSLRLDFVSSVAVGLLAAVGIFLVKYSQISVIRYAATGASLRSRVTRNPMHDDWLSKHAHRINIFGLQGYIFFGTAYTLTEEILKRVAATKSTTLDAVILDFRHVTGIDTSVVQNFQRLYLQLKKMVSHSYLCICRQVIRA